MASIIQAYFADIEVYDEESDLTPTQTEVNTMVAFLSGDLPVIEAARSLTKRTTHSTSIFDLRTRQFLLWSLINKIAVNLPVVQPRIVDLLQTIRTLKPTKEGSNTICPDDTWSSLNGWINNWADSINNYETGYLWPEEHVDKDIAAKWPHVTAYSARLTATRDPVVGHQVFIRRSAPCIVRVLDIDLPLEGRKRELDIIAAAQLCILSPRELFESCQAENSIYGLDESHIQETRLWEHDMRKLSVERWEHWKVRWQSIRDTSRTSDEIRNVASRSLDAMNSIV